MTGNSEAPSAVEFTPTSEVCPTSPPPANKSYDTALVVWRGVYFPFLWGVGVLTGSSNAGLWFSFPVLLRFLVTLGVIAVGGP
ncbi:hypothetical protein BD779DRAFT_1520106, partial [Infundibulicybe gibba]